MPPDYVLQYLPLDMLGAVAIASAVVWGVVLVRKAWAEVVLPIVHRIRTTAQRVEQVMEDWSGRPARPGVPAQPGVMVRLADYDERIIGLTNALSEGADDRREQKDQIAAIVETLGEVQYNVKSNSGHSAHDDLTKKLDANTKLLQELLSTVTEIVLRQSTQGNDMQDIRQAFTAALRHNHPDYRPPDWSDRFTD